MQTIRRTAREWRRHPWLAATIVATIALCVGANVAVFTLVRSIVLLPLPYPDAHQLLAIGARPTTASTDTISITPAAFFAWRSQPQPDASIAAYYPDWNVTLVERAASRRLVAGAISSNLLRVLGLRLDLGRAFTPDEEWAGTGQQAILSHALWRDRFGSRPDIIGKEIVLGADGWPLGRQRSTSSGTSFTVVGVLAPGASLPDSPVDLLVPLRALGDDVLGLTPRVLRVVGRASGSDPAAAGLLAQRISSVSVPGTLAQSVPWVAPLHDLIVGKTSRFLGIVAGAVVVILLLGCANLATVMLLRSTARARETAVRIAIGARLRDLLVPVVLDAAFLGALGGVGASAVARLGLGFAMPILATDLPRVESVTMDYAVIGGAFAVAMLCVLVPGIAVAARFPRHAPYDLLRDGQRVATPSINGNRLRLGLVVTQFVLGFVLVVAAGLLLRSVDSLLRTDIGFEPNDVSTLTLTLPRGLFSRPGERTQFFQRAIDQARRTPGVFAASATSDVPLRDGSGRTVIALTDEQLAFPTRRVAVASSEVFERYFDVMRIRVSAGRDFAPADARDSLMPRVAIVNAAFVARHLRGADPLGRRVAVGGGDNPQWYTIVGVVNDTRDRALRATAEPHLFMNAAQVIGSTMNLVVRSRTPSITPHVRPAVSGLHPFVQPYDEMTMTDVVRRAMVRERAAAGLLTTLSTLALVLLAIGVFGVMSAVVSERSREIAVRMALGASPKRISQDVLAHGGRIVAIAVAIGLPSAWAAVHAVQSLLYGVTPATLTAYLWAVVAIGLAALVASIAPVRRAIRIDPLDVMRTG